MQKNFIQFIDLDVIEHTTPYFSLNIQNIFS